MNQALSFRKGFRKVRTAELYRGSLSELSFALGIELATGTLELYPGPEAS